MVHLLFDSAVGLCVVDCWLPVSSMITDSSVSQFANIRAEGDAIGSLKCDHQSIVHTKDYTAAARTHHKL